MQNLKEYEYHLRRIEELLLQLQENKSDSAIVNEFEMPFSVTNKSKILHEKTSVFEIPCRITSHICGKRNEKLQESKTSKIFSLFKMKEHISKSSINTENEFSHISSETNLESNFSCKCTKNVNKTPINIQISADGGDSNSSLKIVVKVPSRVLEILNCRGSQINNSESFSSTNTTSRCPKLKRIRLKSVFSKLLYNTKTKSCTSASTQHSSSITKSEIFSSEMEIPENPIENLNSNNSFPAFSEFSQVHIALRTSGPLNTEFCNSDEEETNESIFEKKINEIKPERKRIDPRERKLTLEELYPLFLENKYKKNRADKLNSENGNSLSYYPRYKQNLEIPIDVKITKFPLFLKKSYHSYKNKASVLRKEELLEILTQNLSEEVLDKYFTGNDRRFRSKRTFLTNDKSSVRETSSIEYLLQNYNGAREKREMDLRQPAEKDWHQVNN